MGILGWPETTATAVFVGAVLSGYVLLQVAVWSDTRLGVGWQVLWLLAPLLVVVLLCLRLLVLTWPPP
jgi:hypothetical protein